MRAIDRKLVRDLRGMRGQVIAIALVIIGGVSTYVSMTSIMDSLLRSQETYYGENRFADGFASVRRAPERVGERLRDVPGIGEVQTRVVAAVNLEIDGFDEPVSGHLYSLPDGGQPQLNRVVIRAGRFAAPGRENEVLLNEIFAQAHDFSPGDELTAIINGRRRTLSVAGIAISPEHLMQIQPGSIFPDAERYGVLWMGRDALAAAYDMVGAFNDVVFSLAPGASIDEVIDHVDEILRPYGGQGAFARADQASHRTITEEFRQLEGMSAMLPIIFLAVAAFLLNIVVTRLIGLQREQIAVLKAFGYSNLAVGLHYIKLVLLIAVIGSAIGTALGIWMGRALGNLYLEYYRFPQLEYILRPGVVFTAFMLTAGAALAGVLFAVRRAVRLAPAEAMRAAPPASYRPTVVERLGLKRFFDQPTRIIMRNLERQPIKSLLTVIGMASSCAILIMGLFFNDSFDRIIEVQFGHAQRDDYTVSFVEPSSSAALHEIRSVHGVQYAEPFRTVPVRLHREHRSYDAAIEGIPPDAYLRRVIDTDLQPVEIPSEGLVLTERLAEVLRVQPGQTVHVEILEGRRRTVEVSVVATAQQYIGVGAYMDLEAANRLIGGGSAISGVFVMLDAEADETAMMNALRERPRIASIISQDRVIQSFMDTSAEVMLIYTFILSLFAGVIAFGVVYNSARISLSERDRELASLRVLGFTRGEIAYILLGELAVLTLLAIPIGLLLGALSSAAVAEAVATDLYTIPQVLSRRTFAMAAVVVLVSAGISAILIRRKLDTLDLIGVLKTRE
jgi:putative ABC transport system permease protein